MPLRMCSLFISVGGRGLAIHTKKKSYTYIHTCVYLYSICSDQAGFEVSVLRSHLMLFFFGRKDMLCVCVCERERVCVCVFVCVYEKEKESLRVCLLDNRNRSML